MQNPESMESRLAEILKATWGYEGFLPMQREAMTSVLGHRDSVVILPTGGGKSLCFQAPALLLDGTAIVVSPLVSLMKDQVDALLENGVAAGRLESTQSPDERRDALSRLKAGELKLLYLSPERLFINGFLDSLSHLNISFFAIDEAHCISMWGHDFRPEYSQLGMLKKRFPKTGIHAYTATATTQVRGDIGKRLKLKNQETLVGSFFRSNLKYSVERMTDKVEQVKKILDRHKGESGIVYCISRKDVDELSETLNKQGYKVAPYHAGLEPMARLACQNAFISENVDTIVATVAFGMGIDKSNVRYVVHAGMPKSVEHYQQESGRAGRDGLEADCVLLYGGGDFNKWSFIMRGMEPAEAHGIAMKKLGDISNYCAGVDCRHESLLGYFDEILGQDNCSACDVCLGDLEMLAESQETSQKILSCVVRLKEKFGGEYISQVLLGSKERRILENGHDQLTTYGVLAGFSKSNIRSWIEQLAGQGFLRKYGEYNQLMVTERGWQALRGEETPRLMNFTKQAPAKSKTAKESWVGVNVPLFEHLREKRKTQAANAGVPAFAIFSDATLRDMARKRPTTLEAFECVFGIGERKAKKYGKTYIERIFNFCKEHELTTDVEIEPPKIEVKKSTKSMTAAKRAAFDLFAKGKQVEEVAEHIQRKPSTTSSYLADYIIENKITDPSQWLDLATHNRIREIAKEEGAYFLAPIFAALNEEVPYEQIKISLACMANE